MNNTVITKKQLLELMKDLDDSALITFKAYHYEPSGKKSNIGDNLNIRIGLNAVNIVLEEDKPECLSYDE